MKIKREWAMPSKDTFTIQPIKELIFKYGGDFAGWIDPFCGDTSPVPITLRNDLNPAKIAANHMKAEDFIKMWQNSSLNGALFDPPYSNQQMKEVYEGARLKYSFEDSQSLFQHEKKLLAPKIKTGGIAICCGWNSGGFGKGLGFEFLEILLVAHGGSHHDTIVTVERKFTHEMF